MKQNSNDLGTYIPSGTAFEDANSLIFRRKITSKYKPSHFWSAKRPPRYSQSPAPLPENKPSQLENKTTKLPFGQIQAKGLTTIEILRYEKKMFKR